MKYLGEQIALLGNIESKANIALTMHINRIASAKIIKNKIFVAIIVVMFVVLFNMPQMLEFFNLHSQESLQTASNIVFFIGLWVAVAYSFFKLEYVPKNESEVIKQVSAYLNELKVNVADKVDSLVQSQVDEKIEALLNILADDGILYSKAALENIVRLCQELQEDFKLCGVNYTKTDLQERKKKHSDKREIKKNNENIFEIEDAANNKEIEYEDEQLFEDEFSHRNYPGLMRKS